MSISSQLLHRIADPALTRNERARLRCQVAKELEDIGNYEAAREAMGELWSRVGERPVLDVLDEPTAAEVILRAGTLTGWIGSVKQIEGAQEIAKNLISESITRFDALQGMEQVAEAQTELGYCYWREGAFDEARVVLSEALSRLADIDNETKAVALLRSAIVERGAKRFNDAYRILTVAAPLIDEKGNDTLKGKFHNQFATVLENLGRTEKRKDYIDRALIEYAAASYHFEQAGHRRYQACVENNLGFLFGTIEKFREAHQHLDRAQALFTSMKDSVHTAQVDDTRAELLLAEGRISEAERLVRSAVQILERGGEQSLLAEALTTHGITLARMNSYRVARQTLQRAIEVAENAGDPESAGLAALTILEELADHLPARDLSATYDRAAELLASSAHQDHKDRLLTASRRVLFLIGLLPAPPSWRGFNFYEAVRRCEAHLIERALREAGGVVAQAAQLLGIGRTGLDAMLHRRHKALAHLRTPVAPRRRSLMFRDEMDCPDTRAVAVLHVEDDAHVASTVRTSLDAEGWSVETCGDGPTALEKLESGARYDVLIFDNQLLPGGLGGVELIRRTRALAHRRQTPIIMLSGDDGVEMPARRAGANAFLRQPGEMSVIAETVARLLARRKGSMKLFAIVVLAGLLLDAPAAAAPDSCACAGRARCVNGDASEGISAALKRPVTLELRAGTNRQFADELSRLAGQRIAASPTKPDNPLNLDIKSAALWDALEILSRRSAIRSAGEEFSKLRTIRQALADGEQTSVCITGAAVSRVVSETSSLSGQVLRVTSGTSRL